MAVETIRRLICDVGERHEAQSTMSFGLTGQLYEVDVCDRHAKQLEKDMAGWIAAGRRIGRGPQKRAPQQRASTVSRDAESARAWAKLTGAFNVQDSGRVSPTVLKAWRDAGAPAA